MENGLKFPWPLLLPNCSSWITGFEALLGGDPQKNGGGDDAIWSPNLSHLGRMISSRSSLAFESSISDW
jgi:hypothetical protein